MIVRREFLMLTCNANLAEFRFEFVDPTTQVQSTQSSCAFPQRQSWAPHMEHLEQHQGSVCLESWASCGNNPSSLSGFSSSHPGINVPSAPEDHPAKILWKTALVLSQAVQRVVILFPLWLETSQCPSLTSSSSGHPSSGQPGRVWTMVVLHRCLLWTLSPAEVIYLP